jgi:hypothetical protein
VIEIPDNVSQIYRCAFSNCTSLKKVNCGKGLKKIKYSAFSNCEALKEIQFNEGLLFIDVEAFRGCNYLTRIGLPKSIVTICKNSFSAYGWLINDKYEWEWGYGCIPSLTDIYYSGTKDDYKNVCISNEAGLNDLTIHYNSVIPKPLPFVDIKKTWYYESLENVFSRGIMTGTDPTHFSPEMNLSRAMVATILYRMAGSPDVDTSVVPFPDIPKKPKAWYFAPIVWAKSVGVTNGYATGEFGRDDNISRQDFMKMLYSYALFKNLDVSVRDENSYLKAADGSAVSKYARTMVNWGYENGFIGNNSDLKPKDAITRAEAATIISRFINKYGL